MTEEEKLADAKTEDKAVSEEDPSATTDAKVDKEEVAAEAEVADASDDSAGAKSKKKRGVGFTILVIVIAIIAVGGIAGGSVYLAFHSNPLFCNAVCHDPMDPYVTSYTDGQSVNPNQGILKATDVGSVTFHKNELYNDTNIVCVSCHNDGITENLRQGASWVTGAYKDKLPLTLHVSAVDGSDGKYGVEFCLREGCHTNDAGKPINDAAALQLVMDDAGFTPHKITKPGKIDNMQHDKYWVDGTNGLVDCSTCHQTHEQSVYVCTECHSEGGAAKSKIAAVPEGWLTYSENIKQGNKPQSK